LRTIGKNIDDKVYYLVYVSMNIYLKTESVKNKFTFMSRLNGNIIL
jgi:hypothetical protein